MHQLIYYEVPVHPSALFAFLLQHLVRLGILYILCTRRRTEKKNICARPRLYKKGISAVRALGVWTGVEFKQWKLTRGVFTRATSHGLQRQGYGDGVFEIEEFRAHPTPDSPSGSQNDENLCFGHLIGENVLLCWWSAYFS